MVRVIVVRMVIVVRVVLVVRVVRVVGVESTTVLVMLSRNRLEMITDPLFNLGRRRSLNRIMYNHSSG